MLYHFKLGKRVYMPNDRLSVGLHGGDEDELKQNFPADLFSNTLLSKWARVTISLVWLSLYGNGIYSGGIHDLHFTTQNMLKSPLKLGAHPSMNYTHLNAVVPAYTDI